MATGRGGGKTTRVLKWLMEHPNATVVAFCEREADRLFGLAKQAIPDIERRQFISSERAKERLHGLLGPVYVDNADILLANMLGTQPDAITMTGWYDA